MMAGPEDVGLLSTRSLEVVIIFLVSEGEDIGIGGGLEESLRGCEVKEGRTPRQLTTTLSPPVAGVVVVIITFAAAGRNPPPPLTPSLFVRRWPGERFDVGADLDKDVKFLSGLADILAVTFGSVLPLSLVP